jgi:hypothetical protein
MEFSGLADCHFPCLRKLVLTLQSGATSRIDASRARFIEAHPTIEELQWIPISPVTLAPGSLPVLKRLRTTTRLAISILSDKVNTPRSLECIYDLFLSSEIISELEGVDGRNIRELSISQLDDLSSISKLADLFPSLTSLALPHYWPNSESARNFYAVRLFLFKVHAL